MLLRKITQTALLHMHDRPFSEPDGLRQKSFLQLIKINWQQILSLECRLDACAPYAQHILICLGLLLLLCWRISDRRDLFVSSHISEKEKTDHSGQLQPVRASCRTCKRSLLPPPPLASYDMTCTVSLKLGLHVPPHFHTLGHALLDKLC